jgi:hypothetical protein
MMKADPMYEAREVQRLTQVQTIAAKDGFVFSPVNYEHVSRQKTLLDVEQVFEEKINVKNLDSEDLY